MTRFSPTRWTLRSLLLLCAFAVSASAQQPPESTPPRPAARSMPPISDVNNPQDESQTPGGQLQPDNTSLTGILTPTLGTPQLEHSFFTLGAQVASTIQSAGLGSSGWYANNYLLGNFSLYRNWRQALTSINYSGGGYITTSSLQSSGGYQNLSFSQEFRTARWNVSLVDAFVYLPQSQFGFGGGTNLGQPGTGGTPSVPPTGINGEPSQNIFSATGTRYTNTAVAQTNYAISARDSLTFSGSYENLRFPDSTNQNSDTILGGIGYNREVTKIDTFGLFYNFSAYHYSGLPQAFGSHSIGVAYGRKITGKLALQLSGGPQINTYRVPLNGSSKVFTGFGSAILTYGMQNGNIGLAYRHGLSNGSGVLIGSQLDQVTLSGTRRLNRVWTGMANFGYARNASLFNIAGSGNSTYNDWFAGGGLSRPFGREVMFAVSYTAYFERSSLPGCIGVSCNTDFTQQVISLSLQWHTRPFVLR